MSKIIFLSLLAAAWLLPLATDAHQPKYVAEQARIEVVEPEVSKAYYGVLTGQVVTYMIDSGEPFDLYASLYVPDTENSETDFGIEITGPNGELVFVGDSTLDWQPFHEEFANDDYLQGPEFRLSAAEPGVYLVQISSPDNQGQYVLAIGEQEVFAPGDVADAFKVIPQLKSSFFNKSGFSFAASVFGAAFIVFAMLVGVLIGFVYRRLIKLFLKRHRTQRHTAHRNIGLTDRLLRVMLAVACLLLGIYLWQPLLLVASGFIMYEAAASWCVLYSALGRNTCPM